jgi:hypothetical protein
LGAYIRTLNLHFLAVFKLPSLFFDGYQSCPELIRTKDDSKGNFVTFSRSELR